jgi:hypothetical protein
MEGTTVRATISAAVSSVLVSHTLRDSETTRTVGPAAGEPEPGRSGQPQH